MLIQSLKILEGNHGGRETGERAPVRRWMGKADIIRLTTLTILQDNDPVAYTHN